MYALAGIARAGATRANATSPAPYVSIDGVQYAQARANDDEKVLAETVTITESNDGAANTCSFTCYGFEPVVGQDVVITLGSTNNGDRQFAGTILTVAATYTGTPANASYTVSCTDYTWQLTRRRVTKRYVRQSATAIALDLIGMVDGFSSAGVQQGLPYIDEISFTFDTVLSALQQLSKRVGAFVRVSYRKIVSLSTSNTRQSNPIALTTSTGTFRDLSITRDISPVVTRSFVAGGGVNALAAARAGDTQLAVEDTAWYNPDGGQVVCSAQRLTYTGIQDGGGGSLVGPGLTPSTAPSLTLVAGSGLLPNAVYQYGYTWQTASGETVIGPLASITTVSFAVPAAPTFAGNSPIYGTSNIGSIGATVTYKVAYGRMASATDYSQDGPSSSTISITLVDFGDHVHAKSPFISLTYSNDPLVTWVRLWRDAGSGFVNAPLVEYASGGSIAGSSNGFIPNVVGGGVITIIDGDLKTANYVGGAAEYAQVQIDGVARGPSGTTGREIYRTVANGSQPKALHAIADNSTTSYLDSSSDGVLGADSPSSDTSGLPQPSGQVLPGVTSLPLAGAGAFNAGGGLAIIGNGQQVIRYTGVSGNALTGVPASGSGAITAPVSYNSSVTAAPCLTGIPASGDGSVVTTIAKGDPVNVLAQVDDTTSQADMAAVFGGGDDGVIEDYDADGRISEAEAIARATAVLEQNDTPRVTASYLSWDNNHRAGRTVTISITNPTTLSSSALPIQRMTVSAFQPAAFPQRQVQASDTHYGIEDLFTVVRQVKR
jgi:hypothetical protein